MRPRRTLYAAIRAGLAADGGGAIPMFRREVIEWRRRAFIAGLGAAAAAPPLIAGAEQRIARIGYLGPGYTGRESGPEFRALLGGLGDLGYVEGRDFEIETRW